MVTAALHATGGVGPVASVELPQPESNAANATHTGIRMNIPNAIVRGSCNRVAARKLMRRWLLLTPVQTTRRIFVCSAK
jgi:hypothetical protein